MSDKQRYAISSDGAKLVQRLLFIAAAAGAGVALLLVLVIIALCVLIR